MVHRGTTREPKKKKQERVFSSPEAKQRRHRNKVRIWRRAVKRLREAEAQLQTAAIPA